MFSDTITIYPLQTMLFKNFISADRILRPAVAHNPEVRMINMLTGDQKYKS
jgi:hypothetical protein